MIHQINIKNFTRFDDSDFNFSEGINVFLGQNGTGKTHLLKLLSSVLKANEQNNGSGKEKFETILADKLLNYFKPESLGRLVKRTQGRSKAEISISLNNTTQVFSFSTNAQNSIRTENYQRIGELPSLYLPPREIISVFEGFLSLYQKREISFDETYYHLALALDSNLLKGRRFDDAQLLIKPLESITNAKVLKKNGRFYLKNEQGEMEMPLIAEGLRKIATLMYLIINGELSKNSVLFWDEPEANLNPMLISQIVDILVALANNGIQIFIASHDYLLTHLLSLKSEYHHTLVNAPTPPIRFFGLYEQDARLTFDEGKILAELSQNPILKEFTKYHDLEQQYFYQSLKA